MLQACERQKFCFIIQDFVKMHWTESQIDTNGSGRIPEAIAMDCEMVGGGSDGSLDICARVCLVDEEEKPIFHTYVVPLIPVTNFRYLGYAFDLFIL